MKPVLIVIDAQNGWLGMSEGLKRSVDEHIDSMREAISIFRRAGAPIIFTYHSYNEERVRAGNERVRTFPRYRCSNLRMEWS